MRNTRTPKTILRLIGIVAVLALIVAACGDDDDSSPVGDQPATLLATVAGSDTGNEALISGVLDVTDSCVLLDERGESALLVWPTDRSSWNSDAGTVDFTNREGETFTLADGDEVMFSGGGSSVDEGGETAEQFHESITWDTEPPLDCVQDTRWFINDIVPAG